MVIDQVRALKIPVTSFVLAARYVAEKYVGSTSKPEYEMLISQLINEPYVATSIKEAELMFGYLIQESVRMHVEGYLVKGPEAMDVARAKTKTFVLKNPWLMAETLPLEVMPSAIASSFTPSLTTSTKKRVGASKKDMCLALFNQDDNAAKTRKELIEIFVAKLELTPAGASTYVHNCQKGIWK